MSLKASLAASSTVPGKVGGMISLEEGGCGRERRGGDWRAYGSGRDALGDRLHERGFVRITLGCNHT
jgi:hypothetical protein